MIIEVRVKTLSSKNQFIKVAEPNIYDAEVKAAATDGKANEALIKLISEYFSIPRNTIKLKYGSKSRVKLFEF